MLLTVAFALWQLIAVEPARLGDDWIYFHEFDHIALWSADGSGALTKNGTPEDGLRFRPFCYAWIWCERQLFGSYVPSWFVGTLWIGVAGLFLGLWLHACGIARLRATAAGLLFAMHPAQSEVWGWASARIDTMAAALGIAGLWALARRRRVLAYAFFVAAFGSKESAYPLLLAAPLAALFVGRGWRQGALDLLTSCAALATVFGLKAALLGRVFADSWGNALAEIPWTTRFRGWLSFLEPLFVDPASTTATMPGMRALSAVWLGILIAAVALPIVLCASGTRRQRLRALAFWRSRVGHIGLCVCSFALCVTVSFGVAALPDFNGGRLWFLPSAFAVAIVAMCGARIPIYALLGVGVVLLHGNLGPYRGASAAMSTVETRLASEYADERRAIRIRELPALHPDPHRGTVPLFYLMAELWAVGRSTATGSELAPSQYPRVLLTHTRNPPDVVAQLDALWLAEMRRRGLDILQLRWVEGRLVAQ